MNIFPLNGACAPGGAADGATLRRAPSSFEHRLRAHDALPPASETSDAAQSPRADDARRLLARVRVLVVDDDPDTCEVLRRLLEEFGAQVDTHTSVRDALAAWDAGPPDVLVSDIGMPEQDGYTLAREIRRRPDALGGQVPAIALTAFGRPEDRDAALQAGFHVHLRKPVEPDALVAAVARLAR